MLICRSLVESSASQSNIHVPVASASPRNLLDMTVLRLHPEPTELDRILEMGPAICVLRNPPDDFNAR